ncbi:MAG: FAD-dependent oxidoreductase [Pseudomonadales bacterium]|nr:FAD-dependent oxidoreductase [Pseudomonadales bacterium]
MKPTDTSNPSYYHQIVNCQWACPAHTPVPEYIRLIAQKRYTDAYMVNWQSNVFPGILGRTCDRPCEPACRRGRTEEEPVAICRLKRVTADHKGDMTSVLPTADASNGKRIACIGAGPASLTVARDLSLLGYEVVVYDSGKKGGGMMLSQIPSFRLPESVIDEEVGFILKQGVVTHFNSEITSMKSMLDKNYDAVFVGTGAPRGRDLDIPGREEASANIHTGIEWLANVTFEHVNSIGKRVIVLGGGNTAMDCCRTARRLGGEDVKVVVRSGFDEMKASPWEKDDALMEDIPILNYHVPKSCVLDDGKLVGLQFELVKAEYDKNGRRSLVPTGEPDVTIECDDVLIAIGQENSFPWIEKDIGIEFNQWDMPVVDDVTLRSSHESVFFGGDSSFGPKNIISAVGQGHQAAISIDLYCQGLSLIERPAPGVNLTSQKMGVHEWSYDNGISHEERFAVPHADKTETLKNLTLEVELGFDEQLAFDEAKRCLNCDVQTVFTEALCYECDSCMDVCPTNCINFTENGKEKEVRPRLIIPAENTEQPLLVSEALKTGRVMVKDEDLCLHCGLCAERCPTSAWDMQKFIYQEAQAGKTCA